MKILLILIFINSILNNSNCGSLDRDQVNEANLVSNLFKNYSKNVRPSKEIDGKYILFLKQIVSLDEKNQLMVSSSYFAEYWDDPRLSWDPAEYGGITKFTIPAKNLWVPDIIILNTGDTDGYLKIPESNLALINSTGKVYLVISAISLKTRCSMDVRKFPFDTQKCPIILSSWSQSSTNIDFDTDTDSINIQSYVSNSLWDLKSVSFSSASSKERFGLLYSEYKTEDVSFNFELRRRPLYFMMNGIFPCLILNCITIMSYFLPFSTQASISEIKLYNSK